MTDFTWVDLAPTIDPVKAALRAGTGKVVTFGDAPKGGKPPFSVLSIVSDPRIILTMEGGQPLEVTWQVDYMGTTPLQTLALKDLGDRTMVSEPAPELVGATVDAREVRGDAHGPDKVSDSHYVMQARYWWRLIGAVVA